jgi:hypothetical protein
MLASNQKLNYKHLLNLNIDYSISHDINCRKNDNIKLAY